MPPSPPRSAAPPYATMAMPPECGVRMRGARCVSGTTPFIHGAIARRQSVIAQIFCVAPSSSLHVRDLNISTPRA